MVLVSRRMPEPMDAELRALAREASEASGKRVTRSDIERALLADGIRRARAAARYAARFARETTDATARAADQEGATG